MFSAAGRASGPPTRRHSCTPALRLQSPACRGLTRCLAHVCPVESAFFGPAKQYVRWDTGLHTMFEQVVNALGGAHVGELAGGAAPVHAGLSVVLCAPLCSASSVAALSPPATSYACMHAIRLTTLAAAPTAAAAKPAVIRERMGISLLTTAQVKSHLQKHRIRVVAQDGAVNATEAQVGGE